jgi:hypothetical protein
MKGKFIMSKKTYIINKAYEAERVLCLNPANSFISNEIYYKKSKSTLTFFRILSAVTLSFGLALVFLTNI